MTNHPMTNEDLEGAAMGRRQRKEAGVFVPEGPNDRSQAIYCLEQVQSKIRPVEGLILTHGWLVVLIVARLSDPITPSLRDGSLFERIPGNKLPGYDHSVPTGQQGCYPCGTQTRHSTEGRKRG